ncbi:MAG: Smr/MutS family protein [Dehalococcoidales bacterium]|nr:Smr/MutS family protein [Dehalococcoidales bacterium]
MRKKEQLYNAPGIDDECYIRRMTLDEAMPILEKYINDAFMNGIIMIRIVHGKSGGTLRNAVHNRLANHPLIKFYRLGEYGEGGEGVTIAELYRR